MKHILGNTINGVVVGGYTFNAATRTITITGVTVTFEDILLVTNYTRNIDIFNPGCAGKGGSFASPVLTLDYATDINGHANTDILQITVELDMKLALEATQELVRLLLVDIKTNTGKIDTNTDEIEVKLDGINSKLTTLNALDFAKEATQALVRAELQAVNTALGTLNAKDFATQATLSAFKTAFDTRDLATGAKQDELKNTISIFDKYIIAEQDAVSDPAYYGFMLRDGTWLIMRQSGLTTATNRYANVSNNPTKTTLATAWTDRAALTYGLPNTLTGL